MNTVFPLEQARTDEAGKRPFLGELLVRNGRITQRDLDQALAAQREMGDLIGRVLVRLGLVSEVEVAIALCEQLGLVLVRTEDYPEAPLDVPGLLPEYLIAHGVLPLSVSDGELAAAMATPQDAFLGKALRLATGLRLLPRVAIESELASALEKLYTEPEDELQEQDSGFGLSGSDSEFVEHLKDLASEAPVIRLVNQIISRVIDLRASDIHIEPFEDGLHIRYRIDGVLQEGELIDAALAAAVTSRIKLLAHLDIAERRLPQDGRIKKVLKR